MQFLDTIRIPVVSSLPGTGLPGEIVSWGNSFYGWNGTAWAPFTNNGILDGLAALSITPGLLEQTGDASFTKRPIGVATASAILSRNDGDGRYSPLSHTHTLIDLSDVTISVTDLNLLDDGTSNTLHYHAADRDRANHIGAQAISTITGLQTALDAKASTGAIGSSGLTMATARLLGRTTAATGAVEELTAAQATAFLNTFTPTLKGLVPASGGGTSDFLRADGTWAPPASGASTVGWGPITAVGTGASQDITLPEIATTADVLVFVEGVFQHDGYTVSGATLTTTQPLGYNILIVRYGQGQKGDPGEAADLLSVPNTWTGAQTFTTDLTLGGNLLPSEDSVFSIGSATMKWKDIFVSAATVHIGDNTQISGTSIVIDAGGTGNALADIPTVQASKIVAQPYTYDAGAGPITVRPTIEFQVAGQSYPISLNTSTFEFSLDAQGNYGTGSLVAKKITLLNDNATVLNLTGNIIQDGNYTNNQTDKTFRFDGDMTLGYDALRSITVKGSTTFVAPISLQGAATLGDGNDTIAVNAGVNNFTVAAANFSVAANGDVTIFGNANIAAPTLFLNSDLAGAVAPTENVGIQINRGSLADSSWLWDESIDAWSPVGGDIKNVGVLSANSLAVTSTAVVTNLNADKLDGQDASAFASAGHNHDGVYEPAFAGGTTSQYLRGDKTWQTIPAQKLTMALSVAGKPSDGQKIIPRFEVADPFTLLEATSRASAGTAATASTVFTLKKNGSSVGTISWSASGTLGTVDLTATTISFATGDILTLEAPATADSTLADISITLAGTYS